MFLRIFFLFVTFSILQGACFAQEGGGPPKKEQSVKSKRKQYKEDKRKWKEERRNKRAEEKKIRDHHKRIQTKEVRKRMKRNKGKAIRNNTHQREPFFQRLFQKKRGKASKQPKEKKSKVQQH
jgi:hypothetical protein